jgi:molybdopterin converting factor small subunit
MTVTVQLPTALRRFAGNQDSLDMKGEAAADVMAQLGSTPPDLRKHLFNADGSPSNFVNVYTNDEDIRYLKQMGTPLKDSDAITLFPAVAGGMRL